MSTTWLTANRCMHCGNPTVLELPQHQADQVAEWLRDDPITRPLVQVAFPFLTPDQREALISGLHPGCWDAVFGPEDET